MADTIGSLVDKLATVNNKLFMKQELIYEIRRMTFDEFIRQFCMDSIGMQRLYNGLHALSDLNVQRNQLMAEVDLGIIALIKRALAGEELDDGRAVQRAHKTHDEQLTKLLQEHAEAKKREREENGKGEL